MRPDFTPTRRSSIVALLGLLAAGCGGGGSATATPIAGTMQRRSIASTSNATTYPLNIYLPPGIETIRATVPVVYLLDGESRFQVMVDIVEEKRALVVIVGIGNEAMRARDYVPQNQCTPGGGGEGVYLDFIRYELIPFVELTFGGDPLRRILLGHSHGGSFVLHALFNEAPAERHFSAYLASDSSIDCMSATVYGWEDDYADANSALAVRLHLSYSANSGNTNLALQIQSRHYTGLTFASQFYTGGHIGMIPMAFADALALALA